MTNTGDTYITAGQLANLHNVTKQTVLFYDKNGLLSPAFVNENGYRYYSTSQYLTLALILTLRKMNVSLSDIRSYLANRSSAQFEQILLDKKTECERIIEETNLLKESLITSLTALQKVSALSIDTIIRSDEPAQPLLVSESLSDTMPLHERLSILSAHTQRATLDGQIRPFDAGWILRRQDFFDGRFNHTLGYYFALTPDEEDRQNDLRPAGTYLTINFRGTYYQQAQTVRDRLCAYMEQHCLTPTGHLYLLPLKDHRQTENTDEYLNQLTVRVVPTDTHT